MFAGAHRFGLTVGAMALAIGLIGVPILSASLIVSNHNADVQRRSTIEVDNLIRLIADGMRQPVRDLSPDAGAAFLSAIEADPRFVSVAIASTVQGDFLYFTRPVSAGADIDSRTVPILYDGQRIGEVTARIDRGKLLAAVESGWTQIVLLVALQLLFSLGAVGFLIWLTTRVTRNRTLAAANRDLEAIRKLMYETLDAAPVAISIKGRDLRYVFANRTTLEKYGIERDQMIGRTLREAIGDQVDSDYLEMLEAEEGRLVETGATLPMSTFSVSRTGAWSDALLSKTPIVGRDGVVSHIVTTGVDVTELKQAEAAAIAAKEEAELANMAKSEFLANMSHELRTPLNAIIGFSEIMMSETFGPLSNSRYRDYVRDIHQSGDHLNTIITDLLDVARIEVGAIELDLDDVDPGAIIDSARIMLQRKASRAGVDLIDRCIRPLPAVRGDVVRLRQIFINLIDNAIKFTDAGGSITIGAETPDPGRIAVTVRDTGIGIADTDLERIVEPFVCVQSVATRNVNGTGLGLSLVKSLTEMHGGTVTIASELGAGTAVTIVLPLALKRLPVEAGAVSPAARRIA